MIDYSKIPIQELNFRNNNSVFNYEIGIETIYNKNVIWQKIKKSKSYEDLQLLDNGTLIISQNIFGGQSMISKFTCGLNFCYQLSKFFSNLRSFDDDFHVTLGSDDYYSGWDYDFNLKVESKKGALKLVKDYDFKVEIEFDKKSFLLNYFEFSNRIMKLFLFLYPEIMTHTHCRELESNSAALMRLLGQYE